VTPPAPAVAGKLHATLVFDLDEPSTAPLRVSKIKADLAALDCQWYVAPTASAVATAFKAYSDTSGVPVVFISDDAGKIVATVKAPTKPADVVDQVKALRGAK
jgi:hypothetical protein